MQSSVSALDGARRRSLGGGAAQDEAARRRRRSLTAIATIVPSEDKFQKLKNVRLAGFAFLARTTNWFAGAEPSCQPIDVVTWTGTRAASG